MKDFRTTTDTPTDGPVFSVHGNDNAQPQDKIVWTKGINTDAEADAFQQEFEDRIEPWIKMGDTLMNQINYAMLTASALTKNKSDKAPGILDRIRPVVALKEVIDITVTQRATELLGKLENGELI